MPAKRLNLIKPGGFYGMTPAAHRELTFTRLDGTTFKADPSTKAARDEFKTKFWGTQTCRRRPKWICRWSGYRRMSITAPEAKCGAARRQVGTARRANAHLSYGHCILYIVMQEPVGDLTQGAVAKLAGKFPSGIMRGRFSPKDGQLYVSGLNVWQSDATKFGCLSRVRYTGKTPAVPHAIKTTKTGVTLTFTAPLDESSATDKQNWSVERWNYKWTGTLRQQGLQPADAAKTGKDLVLAEAITLSADKKSVQPGHP
jgi:hypothetical protein